MSHAESKHGRWTEVTMGQSMLDSGRVPGRIQFVQNCPHPQVAVHNRMLPGSATSFAAKLLGLLLSYPSFCFVSDPNLTGRLLLRMQQPEFLLIAQDLAL